MNFGTFCDMIQDPQPDDAVPYLSEQNDNLRSQLPDLFGDLPASIPLANEAFNLDHPEAVNLWIGDERSVSSVHKDHYENFYAVIEGEKTFTLLPPTDASFLDEQEYPSKIYALEGSRLECAATRSWYSQSSRVKKSDLRLSAENCPSESISWIAVDPDEPFCSSKHSDSYKYATPIKCSVQAGEVLYIPAMWYHRVSQTKPTVAVNYWYDQRFDFRYVFYETMRAHAHAKFNVHVDNENYHET
jgi:jumonji domain-containing protein 7